jgi:hypothetical protein
MKNFKSFNNCGTLNYDYTTDLQATITYTSHISKVCVYIDAYIYTHTMGSLDVCNSSCKLNTKHY